MQGSRRLTTTDAVVFDFDGTLVNRDSFLDFSFRYCARRPARLLLVCALAPLAILLATGSQAMAGSVLLWAMTVGGSPRRLVLALRRYARDTLPGYANEAIFRELARHIEAGDAVVIATGSVPLLVRGVLEARKLGRLPVVGSRFGGKWGGLVASTHCVGPVKTHELGSRLGIVAWSTVYTDSFADRSLLKRAEHVTLVSPSRRTLRRTQRLLPQGASLRVLRAG